MTCGKSRLRCSAHCMQPADTIKPRLRVRLRSRPSRLRNRLRNRPSRLRNRLRNRPSRLRNRLRNRPSSLKPEPDGRLLSVRLRKGVAPASLLMSSRRSSTS